MRSVPIWLALLALSLPGIALGSSHGCDFDGDGYDDLVAVSGDGAMTRISYGVLAPGPGVEQAQYIPSRDHDVAGCGDLDGDGNDDLFFNGGGYARIHLMAVRNVKQRGYVPNGGGFFRVAAIADTGADGRDDLIWQGTGVTTKRIDVMNGVASIARGWFAVDHGTLGAVGDVDGDGKTDAALTVGPRGCCVELWRLDGAAATALPGLFAHRGLTDFGLAAIGDLEGTGAGVLVVERSHATGLQSLRWSRFTALGNGRGAWTTAATADLDGDGREDLIATSLADPRFVRIALIAPTVAEPDGPATTAIGWVGTGDGAYALRQIGDFDGDGDADLAFGRDCSVRIDLMNGTLVAQRKTIASCDWTLPELL